MISHADMHVLQCLVLSQLTDASPLKEIHQEGYMCVAYSAVGLIYLPAANNLINFEIQSISNATMFPQTTSNEIILTPVVSITPSSNISPTNKSVIELMKTVQLLDIGNRNCVTMFTEESSWKELDEEQCDELSDRIRFKTTLLNSSYFVAIARYSPPTASIKIDPNVTDTESQVQLTVPELPGFQVEIPPKSVQTATEVKATLFFNDSRECKGSSNQPLASACVLLEPYGQQFAENVSVHIPIPDYLKITNAYPNAKLHLYYYSSNDNDWIVYEESDIRIETIGGDGVAIFLIMNCTKYKPTWQDVPRNMCDTIRVFKRVKSLKSRVQVFMTPETRVNSEINFSIQVLAYRFQDSPHKIPVNYEYILHDNEKQPIELRLGIIHFLIELKEYLTEKKNRRVLTESTELKEEYPATAEFDIDLVKGEIPKGAVFAYLYINDTIREKHWNLIKVCVNIYCTVD